MMHRGCTRVLCRQPCLRLPAHQVAGPLTHSTPPVYGCAPRPPTPDPRTPTPRPHLEQRLLVAVKRTPLTQPILHLRARPDLGHAIDARHHRLLHQLAVDHAAQSQRVRAAGARLGLNARCHNGGHAAVHVLGVAGCSEGLVGGGAVSQVGTRAVRSAVLHGLRCRRARRSRWCGILGGPSRPLPPRSTPAPGLHAPEARRRAAG